MQRTCRNPDIPKYLLDSGGQEAGLVQDKHSYNEDRQTYKRESVTEN